MDHADRELGATLVEAAIVLPVVIMLMFAVLEYGLAYKDYLAVANATRAGARMAAADGNYALADFDILTEVKRASSALPAGAIRQVVIYKASSANSAVPAACTSISGNGGVSGAGGAYCNVYGQALLAVDLKAANFGGGAGSLDLYWKPSARSTIRTAVDDIGVYIRVKHDLATGMFGSSRTLSDSTVARMEPTR